MLLVQFSDSTEKTIIAFLPGPQDPDAYPNQGEVNSTDPRWKAFCDNLPIDVQPFMPK
ncbi:hypothetical protein [Burkholderia cenocepacia]|uniref:hypothetical protein n=1 Tax=Burkholderia cenocepacia TaxID=95486 RepID=UPI0015C55F57|nr:hypothetical protein [Burkholderia cenocepacia]MCW3538356.1 hypothetical protein [Burkholderia cenocepacia]